jgi:LysM repeat protein
MTMTIDPRALASWPSARACPAADATTEALALRRVESDDRAEERDIVALYARRFASVEHPVAVPCPIAPIPFGRSAPVPVVEAVAPTVTARQTMPAPAWRVGFGQFGSWFRPSGGLRRLVTAAFLMVLLFGNLSRGAAAQERYVVQPGDTLESVADTFGVDPEAILQSSWLVDPPNLHPGEVIVIPDPGQSPDDAAAEAAALEGTSPWVASAYYVQDGDTIETIAADFGVDLGTLIDLNGLDDPDLLEIGQRLLIPAAIDEATGQPFDAGPPDQTTWKIPGANATAYVWVPTHKQERNLSCEYASSYIATSAFGNGIPESVFLEDVPPAVNPHDGYRGDIDGWWGSYDNYGVYPEALVPILNDWGFATDVFYSDGDPASLEGHLDAGHPVIVWLALWGDTGVHYDDDGSYTIFAGEHVEVAYAYDDDGVYLSDPAHGAYGFMDWGTFRWAWGTSDGMSLAVWPA